MADHGISSLLICGDDPQVRGIVTDRDIVVSPPADRFAALWGQRALSPPTHDLLSWKDKETDGGLPGPGSPPVGIPSDKREAER
jgi:hypothetical protein